MIVRKTNFAPLVDPLKDLNNDFIKFGEYYYRKYKKVIICNFLKRRKNGFVNEEAIILEGSEKRIVLSVIDQSTQKPIVDTTSIFGVLAMVNKATTINGYKVA